MKTVVQKLNKRVHVKDEVTLGVSIMKLVEELGNLSKSLAISRQDKNTLILIPDLVRTQIAISKLYSKFRFGFNTLSDTACGGMVESNYLAVKKEYEKADTVWLYFRILKTLGQLCEKFNARTQPQDYQFLVGTLIGIQAYVMFYIDSILKEHKLKIDYVEKMIEEMLSNTFQERTITVVDTKNLSKEDALKMVKAVTKKEKAKKEEAKKEEAILEKKNQKKQPANESKEKPPLPPSGMVQELISKLVPRNDAQKVETVDAETLQKIVNGEI